MNNNNNDNNDQQNRNKDNGWYQYQFYVLEELKELKKLVADQTEITRNFQTKISELSERLIRLEVKASLWGGAAGATVVGLVEFAQRIMDSLPK